MNISQLLEALKDTQVSLSVGEKLIAGFSVAILSMSVVFIVLIAIAGLISLLQREKKSIETKPLENNEKIEINEEVVTEEEDMGVLVSVITAAICAATGNNSNNIVVKKIVRSNNSKSSWESMKKN